MTTGRMRFAMLTVGVFALAFALSYSYVHYHLVHAQFGRSPLTAVMKMTGYDPDGIARRTELTTYAIRADGSRASWVRKFQGTDTTLPISENRQVLDIPGHRDVTIYASTESISTVPVTPERIEKYQAKPDGACSAITEGKGKFSVKYNPTESSMQGYKVIEIDYAPIDSQGERIVRQEWIAPGLECLMMKDTMVATMAMAGIEKTARNEKAVIEVKLGEPDPALFYIPQTYVERSPSQILAEDARRHGDTICKECQRPSVPMLDQAYHKRRGEQP